MKNLAIFSLYVDDILLIENCPNMIDKTKSLSVSKFEMKVMGATTYILGIRVSRDRNSRLLYFDHETYLENLIKRFEMDKSKPLSTPVSTGQNLSKKMCHQDEIEIEKNENSPLCPDCG